MSSDSFDLPSSAPLVDGNRQTAMAWMQLFSRWHRVILSLQQSGPTTERPTSVLWVGRRFFDTTLGKPVWLKTASPVVWVDGVGTPC